MQTTINNLINKMDQNMQRSNDDNTYIKNGLRHCSICDEPLQQLLIILLLKEKE